MDANRNASERGDISVILERNFMGDLVQLAFPRNFRREEARRHHAGSWSALLAILAELYFYTSMVLTRNKKHLIDQEGVESDRLYYSLNVREKSFDPLENLQPKHVTCQIYNWSWDKPTGLGQAERHK